MPLLRTERQGRVLTVVLDDPPANFMTALSVKRLASFFASHDRVYVIEENRDGQMAGMLRMEIPATAAKIRSVLHYDGLPLDAQSIVEEILAHENR